MQSVEDQTIQSNTNKTRNSIGGISYSKTNSYDTFDDKDAKTYGWIKAEYKELIKSGDSLVAFNREGKKKFYVKIKQTNNTSNFFIIRSNFGDVGGRIAV